MKYFAVLLGKRNEHQRADRDAYITVDESALQQSNQKLKFFSQHIKIK